MKKILNKIDHYTSYMMKTSCPYLKNYYGNLIRNEVEKLMNYDKLRQNERQFTLEELSKYNGTNGIPAYVAVDGIVYDLSLVPSWGGGTHFGLYAGNDLTKQFNSCHEGGIKILEGLPKVGVIK
ncbi:cytochrome b5 domain-containing protein [Clostridium guangxiense]|uniref:cytochrome b5 domain-containing protein n=1 Tax=Clostridium guangxiense TaxID=1662055 RepID=UPI0022AA31EB|nr:cytochrome b5 domain-containing protein [Clostridium guangxiense]